jgi:hypothetical protein
LQVGEENDAVKDALLITYVCCVLESGIKKVILFCKSVDGRATSLEVFSIINHFLEENEINWENCIGLCTDGESPVIVWMKCSTYGTTKKLSHII